MGSSPCDSPLPRLVKEAEEALTRLREGLVSLPEGADVADLTGKIEKIVKEVKSLEEHTGVLKYVLDAKLGLRRWIDQGTISAVISVIAFLISVYTFWVTVIRLKPEISLVPGSELYISYLSNREENVPSSGEKQLQPRAPRKRCVLIEENVLSSGEKQLQLCFKLVLVNYGRGLDVFQELQAKLDLPPKVQPSHITFGSQDVQLTSKGEVFNLPLTLKDNSTLELEVVAHSQLGPPSSQALFQAAPTAGQGDTRRMQLAFWWKKTPVSLLPVCFDLSREASDAIQRGERRTLRLAICP